MMDDAGRARHKLVAEDLAAAVVQAQLDQIAQDRAAAADDEASWPKRKRGNEDGPALKPVEHKRSMPPPIMPRGRDF